MEVKKIVLKKIMSTGEVAEFVIVKRDGQFEGAIILGGRLIHGAGRPVELAVPKGDTTHYMGARPQVGLTENEAERILDAIRIENSVLTHQGE